MNALGTEDNGLENLVKEPRSALPEMTLLDRVEDVRPYECDGLSAYRELPGVHTGCRHCPGTTGSLVRRLQLVVPAQRIEDEFAKGVHPCPIGHRVSDLIVATPNSNAHEGGRVGLVLLHNAANLATCSAAVRHKA